MLSYQKGGGQVCGRPTGAQTGVHHDPTEIRDPKEIRFPCGGGHDRIDPRIVDDRPQLGALGRAISRARVQGDRAQLEGDIEALRRDPSAVAGLGVTDIVDHYDGIIRGLETSPIIMGHSFGGLFTQMLLDRGLGAAGVAIDPAPVKGILTLPLSTLRVALPVLSNPANNHRALPITPEHFHYAFTNTLSEAESLVVYERYAVPGPDHSRRASRTSTRTRRPRSTSTTTRARLSC